MVFFYRKIDRELVKMLKRSEKDKNDDFMPFGYIFFHSVLISPFAFPLDNSPSFANTHAAYAGDFSFTL